MNEQEMINAAFEDLLQSLRKGTTEESIKLIRTAFEFAREAHQGVKRKSGEPYILHPIAVAKIAAKRSAWEPSRLSPRYCMMSWRIRTTR